MVMYHQGTKTFWGRTVLGNVRLITFTEQPPIQPNADKTFSMPGIVKCDVVIPAEDWATIVAAVSKIGDREGRYEVAKEFHTGQP
jgi:hypothetical protein